MSSKTLDELRKEIDSVDAHILSCINKRMKLVKRIGGLKRDKDYPIFNLKREKEILESLFLQHDNSLDMTSINSVFSEIFSISRNMQLPQTIAYLGPDGSFAKQAAIKKLGKSGEFVSVSSIKGVFRMVNDNKNYIGVVPIENSLNGIVNETITSFQKFDVKVIAEEILGINLVLATRCSRLKDIQKIYSKDEAFAQTTNFLEDLDMQNDKIIPVSSTAMAARMALKDEKSAAICSKVAANLYGVPILFKNIENIKNNKTRFFIIGNFDNEPTGDDKTSILARLLNKSGALVGFLDDFNKENLDLTKIKSHIVNGLSIFFIDFKAHYKEENVQRIFQKHKENIKFLGSYARKIYDV